MEETNIKELLENNRYEVLSKIGEGATGEVFAANDKLTQSKCALKVAHFFDKNIEQSYEKELNYSLQFSHPNIVNFISSHRFTCSLGKFGVTAMEHMDADLLDHILKKGTCKEDQARKIFQEICKGIDYLHSINISHLDLKPENILIKYGEDEEISQVKICDFGYSSASVYQEKVNYGTKEYLPLECLIRLLDHSKDINEESLFPMISEKSDIWSLGVVLFIIMTGLVPFVVSDNKIVKYDLNIIKSLCNNVNSNEDDSNSCYSLLEWIFKENPYERPTIKDILNHPWLKVNEPLEEVNANALFPIDFTHSDPIAPSNAFDVSFLDFGDFQEEINAIEETPSPRVGKKRKFFAKIKNNVKKFFP